MISFSNLKMSNMTKIVKVLPGSEATAEIITKLIGTIEDPANPTGQVDVSVGGKEGVKNVILFNVNHPNAREVLASENVKGLIKAYGFKGDPKSKADFEGTEKGTAQMMLTQQVLSWASVSFETNPENGFADTRTFLASNESWIAAIEGAIDPLYDYTVTSTVAALPPATPPVGEVPEGAVNSENVGAEVIDVAANLPATSESHSVMAVNPGSFKAVLEIIAQAAEKTTSMMELLAAQQKTHATALQKLADSLVVPVIEAAE